MSYDPPNRFNLPGGGKYYQHPQTGERFDSVTSVLETWDKDGLKIWATGLSADMAIDSVPMLLAAGLVQECGNTYNRCYQKHGREGSCERCPCGECSRCWHRRIQWKHSAESARRAEEGTEVHAAINHWVVMGGDRLTLREPCQPYFEVFLRFVEDYGLKPGQGDEGSWLQTEATLLNRDHMYAGTSDAAVGFRFGTPKGDELMAQMLKHGLITAQDRIAPIRIDYKTREKLDQRLYNDMVLQGEAYERCSKLMLPDGTELDAPRTVARYVLQIRPDDYSFLPMRTGDDVYEVFLGLLTAYRWVNSVGGDKAFDSSMPWLNPAPFQEQPAAAPPPPAKKAAKKAASATATQDPFELAAAAKQHTTPPRRSASGSYPLGAPRLEAMQEEIPF